MAFNRYALAALLARLGVPERTAGFAVRLMPLLIVGLATLAVIRLRLAEQGVIIVGAIQSGLPPLHWVWPTETTLGQLALPALIMALVGMVQNIAMAQALAIQRRERVSANREIFGLGVASAGRRRAWRDAGRRRRRVPRSTSRPAPARRWRA